jgi:hypothetical protein
VKTTHLVLIIPFLIFFTAAVIIDLGTLIPGFPDVDLTPYLAATSLVKDGDLAYTREDSDRYLKKYDTRPAPFKVAQKKIFTSSGQYKSYFAFYDPEIFPFLLAPFVGVAGFRGWLIFHSFLIFGIYVLGWIYYRAKDEDAISPSINSVIYFTLIPVPVLFLLPSHHLFILAVTVAMIFSGLRGWPILSAIFAGIAFSSQPFAAVYGLFLLSYWQVTTQNRTQNPIPRFVVAFVLVLFAVWGIERLMYPVANTSAPRWVLQGSHLPLAQIWNSLPDASTYGWSWPQVQRLFDFLLGRNSGFVIYAFVAASLLLSCLWLIRDALVRAGWLFIVLSTILISFLHPSGWNVQSFVNDVWILLCPLPFFLAPFVRPKTLFVSIAVPAAFLIGPLLINPLGAITNRSYYSYSFPYKFLPVEISLVGRAGITKEARFQQSFPGGKIFFLNDAFYQEGDLFWLRGESKLEFLLVSDRMRDLNMVFQNGVLENRIKLKFKHSEEKIRLGTAEIKGVDLDRHVENFVRYEGRYYIRGEIVADNGYVPGLLSRDNPDFRFLSCRIRVDRRL